METSIVNDIKNNPEVLSKVEKTTKYLQTKLGDFAEDVKVEWDQTADQKGQPLLELNLSDWSGKVQERFSPENLDNDQYMEKRLNWLLG